MATRMGLVGCLIVVLALLKTASADVHIVGDDLGWTIPPGGKSAYTVWATVEDFEIGDSLVFNWTGTHSVAEVSQADYDSCIKNDTISLQQTSPATIALNSTGTRYFICTVSTHCEAGQKVTIITGPANSASSLNIGAMSAVLSTILIFFLSYI